MGLRLMTLTPPCVATHALTYLSNAIPVTWALSNHRLLNNRLWLPSRLKRTTPFSVPTHIAPSGARLTTATDDDDRPSAGFSFRTTLVSSSIVTPPSPPTHKWPS